MNTARKIIGVFIIVFFGLPSLFGVIWAVGIIRASVSPEFISDLPRDIIRDVPQITEEIFKAAQDKEVISDEATRAWFQAAAKAGISPRDLMAKTGLLNWMENELEKSLNEVGLILRGERRPRPIMIDLQPLKAALLNPEVDIALMATLQSLPPCDEQGEQRWQKFIAEPHAGHTLPACRPSLQTAEEVLRKERMAAVSDMPNEVEIFEDIRAFHYFPFGFARTIHLLSYLFFLVPAAFIFLGALIAASSPSSFLKWSGASVFIGSLPVLFLALLAKHLSLWAIEFGSFSWGDRWPTELHDLVFDKLGWIPSRIIDTLLSPVIAVAGIVCVFGIVLFAVSFSVRNGAKRPGKASQTSPPAPKSEPEAKLAQPPSDSKPGLPGEGEKPRSSETGGPGKSEA